MLETSLLRKNKINLSDYDYESDIKHRLLMANFSNLDFEVLQEIVFSPIKISLKKFLKSIGAEESLVQSSLEKFQETKLLQIEGDTITVDKDMRKYYESQMVKFEEDFQPGMEFLQGLLKKVPIHVLPVWYSIPRTSNNIFDSLIEKYLITPQMFHRYLQEVTFPEPILHDILKDVYSSPKLKVSSADLIEKYSLTRNQFEEYMLYLEFHFVCCIQYEKEGAFWKEIVTPFAEWAEYLKFIRDTASKSIPSTEKVQRARSSDFAFIEDIVAILQLAKKKPIAVRLDKDQNIVFSKEDIALIESKLTDLSKGSDEYIYSLIGKIRRLKFGDCIEGFFCALSGSNDWLDMRMENRAMYLYRYQIGNFIAEHFPSYLGSERQIREAEKSVIRVLNSGWVSYDDFLQGVMVGLTEKSSIVLKKQGKNWKYTLPQYTDEEKQLIRMTVSTWLYEIGAIANGVCNQKECFMVTPFGQSLFGS